MREVVRHRKSENRFNRYKPIIAMFGFFVVTVSLLLTLEVGLRLLKPYGTGILVTRYFAPQYAKLYRPYSQAHWRGMYRQSSEFDVLCKTNRFALRDYDYSLEKPSDTYRILVLGDSFVEAFQIPIDKTFHKLLQKELPGYLGANKKIEVIAIGRSGNGQVKNMKDLLTLGVKFKPDFIIDMFNKNDIREDGRELFSNKNRIQKQPQTFEWVECNIYHKLNVVPSSYLSRFLAFKLTRWLMKMPGQPFPEVYNAASFNKKGEPSDVYSVEYGPKLMTAWNTSFKYAGGIKQIADKIGAKHLMVVMNTHKYPERAFAKFARNLGIICFMAGILLLVIFLFFEVHKSSGLIMTAVVLTTIATLSLVSPLIFVFAAIGFVGFLKINKEQNKRLVAFLVLLGLQTGVLFICAKLFYAPDRSLDVHKPDQIITKWVTDNDVNVLFLDSAFRHATLNDNQTLHYVEGHWNDAGQRLAADVIKKHLKNKMQLGKIINNSDLTSAKPETAENNSRKQ